MSKNPLDNDGSERNGSPRTRVHQKCRALMARIPKIPGRWLWRHLYYFLQHYRHIISALVITTLLLAYLNFLPLNIGVAFLRAIIAQRTLATLLLIFSALSISLLWSTGQRIDTGAFLFSNIRGKRPCWLDQAMMLITNLGSGTVTVIIAFTLFFVADLHLVAYEIILGTLSLWIVVELLKSIIRRSRPFHRIPQTRIVGYRASGRSFPSGHTSQAFFMATLLVHYFHAGIGIALLLYSIATLVGITRIYVGAHYPRDVLAGIVLGTSWGLMGVMVHTYLVSGAF